MHKFLRLGFDKKHKYYRNSFAMLSDKACKYGNIWRIGKNGGKTAMLHVKSIGLYLERCEGNKKFKAHLS